MNENFPNSNSEWLNRFLSQWHLQMANYHPFGLEDCLLHFYYLAQAVRIHSNQSTLLHYSWLNIHSYDGPLLLFSALRLVLQRCRSGNSKRPLIQGQWWGRCSQMGSSLNQWSKEAFWDIDFFWWERDRMRIERMELLLRLGIVRRRYMYKCTPKSYSLKFLTRLIKMKFMADDKVWVKTWNLNFKIKF